MGAMSDVCRLCYFGCRYIGEVTHFDKSSEECVIEGSCG